MAERPVVLPEDCPEPFWHETHRYCPCCTWQEAPPTINETDEPVDPVAAVHYWRGRWATAASALVDASQLVGGESATAILAAALSMTCERHEGCAAPRHHDEAERVIGLLTEMGYGVCRS